MDLLLSEERTLIGDADAMREAGRLGDALSAYTAIVAAFPASHEARCKLGAAYAKLDQQDAAERCYREAISLWSDYPEANNSLGLILFSRGEFDEAERHYRIALAEHGDFLEALLNLSGLLIETARLLEAKYYANRALALAPQSSSAHGRIGQVLRAFGQISAGMLEFQRAAELDPKSAAALTFVGSAYWHVGKHREAEASLQAALEVAPDFLPAWSNLLLQSNYRVRDREEVFHVHQAFGEVVRRQCGEVVSCRLDAQPDPNRRLRIGFISGDLRRHSVAYFLRGALEYLDRRQFQLFAYYNFRTEDEVTWQLKPLFHHWRSIYGLPNEKASALIRDDEIDILVDLAGHTASACPLVLGRRPAPIQVHWIGYPNTTGLDCIDYRITDEWADPLADGNRYYSEELWRLPESFLCYAPSESAPDPQDPPSLTRPYVTFGSFNSRAKLSDQCIALWCRILMANPESKLVLKSLIGVDDEAARGSLMRQFEAHGIAAGRIEILKRITAIAGHFAAYHEIDIALDPYPYNGTTTTCEALWMGVPVVTLAGDRHASRVGVSLLNNVDLDELIAHSPEEYMQIASALADNPDRLASLRASLRERMSSSRLMDRRAMGIVLGEALRGMWRRYCSRFPLALPSEKDDGVVQPVELLRLHIGGVERCEGWKILDIEQREEVDFVGDIRNLESIADESCSEVYCSHVLEHVGQAEMLDTLNGIYRILAPGGRLYLSVPDLDVLAWLFAHPGMNKAHRFHIMRMMFGSQADEFDFHKIGLNFDFMEDYLRDVGFSSVEHVESFGLFDDSSVISVDGHPISLNLIVTK
ncbi:MAG: tetratricopeptide repeat protein [Rhodocyclales bacterium]|nr:tetratricopeptide repeat protein [Rhodocyclales bacterium]